MVPGFLSIFNLKHISMDVFRTYQAIFTKNKFTGAGICLFIPSTYLLYIVQSYWVFHGVWKPARKGILFIKQLHFVLRYLKKNNYFN